MTEQSNLNVEGKNIKFLNIIKWVIAFPLSFCASYLIAFLYSFIKIPVGNINNLVNLSETSFYQLYIVIVFISTFLVIIPKYKKWFYYIFTSIILLLTTYLYYYEVIQNHLLQQQPTYIAAFVIIALCFALGINKVRDAFVKFFNYDNKKGLSRIIPIILLIILWRVFGLIIIGLFIIYPICLFFLNIFISAFIEDNYFKKPRFIKYTLISVTIISWFALFFFIALGTWNLIKNYNQQEIANVNFNQNDVEEAGIVIASLNQEAMNIEEYCKDTGYVPTKYISKFNESFSNTRKNAETKLQEYYKGVGEDYDKFLMLINEEIVKQQPTMQKAYDDDYQTYKKNYPQTTKRQYCELYDTSAEDLVKYKIEKFKELKPKSFVK